MDERVTLSSWIWRHKKTGGLYYVLSHDVMLEADAETPMVIYRSLIDGVTWARPYREFHDGRFERLSRDDVRGVADDLTEVKHRMELG